MNYSVFMLCSAWCLGLLFTRTLGDSKWCITNGKVEPYNSESHTCCNGTISKLLANQMCCGDTIVSTTDNLCCKDKVEPRFIYARNKKRERKCCGPDAISDDNIACCYDKQVRLTTEQAQHIDDLECCSEGVFADKRFEMCCGGQAISRDNAECCEGRPINSSTHWCSRMSNQEVKLRMDQNICSGEIFLTTKKSCCWGVLHHTVPENIDINQVNPHYGCCKTEVMDPTKDKCCEAVSNYKAHAIPKEAEFECCGDGYYNKTSQHCVNGQAVAKRPGQALCDIRFYNLSTQGCCDDLLRYQKDTEKCCPGPISSIIPVDQKCCNGKGVDEIHLCCANSKLTKKRRVDDDDCCYNAITDHAQTYSTKRGEKCYDGNVLLVAADMEVCGNEVYDPNKSLCCTHDRKFNLVDRNSGNNECCGITPYDDNTKTCCYGRLFEIPTTEAWCCPYDYKAYTFHDTSSPCTAKCHGGNSHYDVQDEICCDGVVHQYRRNFACCGPFYYRHKNRRLPFACCNNKDIFSKSTSVCRDGKVQHKMKGLTDTQGVCYRPQWKSVDGVVKSACYSRYALIGNVRAVRVSRKALPNIAIVKMTMTRVKDLEFGQRSGRWDGPKRLKFVVHVNCTKGIRRRMKRAAVFFSAHVSKGKVTIGAQDDFRIVAYRVVRKLNKYGVKKGFCEQYSDKFELS